FDEGLISAIALLPCGADDARIAAVAVAKARTDGVEKLLQRFVGHDVGCGLAAGGEVSALAQRDHLFDGRAKRLGFGDRGLDALFDDQRSDHVAQQRAAVRCGTSEFVAGYFVTHFDSSGAKAPTFYLP